MRPAPRLRQTVLIQHTRGASLYTRRSIAASRPTPSKYNSQARCPVRHRIRNRRHPPSSNPAGRQSTAPWTPSPRSTGRPARSTKLRRISQIPRNLTTKMGLWKIWRRWLSIPVFSKVCCRSPWRKAPRTLPRWKTPPSCWSCAPAICPASTSSFRSTAGRSSTSCTAWCATRRSPRNSPRKSFLRVYRSRETYRAEARFSTWLYRIATNLGVNYARDTRHERTASTVYLDQADSETGTTPDVADTTPGAEDSLLRRERLNAIRQHVLALPERQRMAVLMHKYEGMDYKQIGDVLKLSESATKSLLFRAYQTLREKLKEFM